MPAAVQRNAIAAFRHHFTLRQTRRMAPIMFSIEFGAGERAPELCRQAEAVDGQHLVEPFEDAGGDTGRLLVEPTGEIAALLYRHRRAPKPAAAPGVPTHAAAWVAARSRCGLYESGSAGSACGRRRCDG